VSSTRSSSFTSNELACVTSNIIFSEGIIMRKTVNGCGVLLVVTLGLLHNLAAWAGEQSLAEGVAAFNVQAKVDEIGKHEPPLTEDEVVAAVRGWVRKRRPVSDAVHDAFQNVAKTGRLPDGAKLSFTTSWLGHNDFHFDVWWVDLHLPTGPGTGYNFRIRDRKIRSRPLTPEERERVEQFRKGFPTTPEPDPASGASAKGVAPNRVSLNGEAPNIATRTVVAPTLNSLK
jgi:hypothetical protein